MRSQTPVRAGRVGAVWDIVATTAFATPWTAALVLGLLDDVHGRLDLGGEPMPDFATSHMLFVTLFGVVVTMWAVVRVMWPVPLLIGADTVGRAAFSTFFVWALLEGHSTILVAFLVPEVGFLIAQGLGVRKALRADREARLREPADDASGSGRVRQVAPVPSGAGA